MKVKELIEILEDMDEDANVLLMCQENWPFEYEVRRVVQRADFSEDDNLPQNDVFLVEGAQLRYGNREAW